MTDMLKTLMIASTIASAPASESFRQTLTSAERGIHLDHWQITARELPLGISGAWSIRQQTLRGGKQEGVDLIVLDNGKMQISLIPTRGMGVLKVEMNDLRLAWDSPVKEVVHPQFVNLQSRGGLGWLDGFNEWMVRCGLEFAGHPGKDKFINNVGDEAEMELTLHGKIGNIPASEVEVVIDREPPHRLRVRGRVHERMFYGPKLELWTELSTEPGSNAFRIEDIITNHGGFDQEFQLIYHANYGPPFLEKGARLIAPVKRVTPFNAHAAKDVARYAEYAGPTHGFIEQVYCLYPLGDADQKTVILLQNAQADRGVSMAYSIAELPYLTLWKNTAAVTEGYVTGLEPGTGFPLNRRVERKFGRVPKLKPREKRRFTIDYAIHTGKSEVQPVAERVRSIQANQAAHVDSDPIPTE